MATNTSDLGFEPFSQLFQTNFPPEELAARRLAVLERLEADDVALLQGAPEPAASELFRQSNDFYYLSGVEVPHSYLLLDGLTASTTLYLPHRDAALESSEERRMCAEDPDEAVKLTGIESVQPLECLALDLQRLVLRRGSLRCHTPFSPAEGARSMRDQLLRAAALAASDPWETPSTREARFVQRLSERFPQIAIADLSPILDRLRLVKSESELRLLRVAGRLSALAARESMRCTRPGMMEFELAAIANLVFTAGGARGVGYRAIVAGGGNSWFGHYDRAGDALRRGDLVLMDYAPDIAYYTSASARMWPVGGHYGPLQRLLYGFVVEYHNELLSLVKPGAQPKSILEEAAFTMRDRLEELRFPDSPYRDAALRALELPGHLSHPVGMSVRDVGDYTDAALEPGMVLALDPTLSVPEHETCIRCKDTVVVTEDGVEVLTSDAPLSVEEIEATMTEASPLLPILAARSWWGATAEPPELALEQLAATGTDGRASRAAGGAARARAIEREGDDWS